MNKFAINLIKKEISKLEEYKNTILLEYKKIAETSLEFDRKLDATSLEILHLYNAIRSIEKYDKIMDDKTKNKKSKHKGVV